MAEREPRSRATLAASIILVVVIGAAVGFVLLSSPSRTNSTSPSTSESTSQTSGSSSTETTNSSLNLRLDLLFSQSGPTVNISADDSNLMAAPNNVTAANAWPFSASALNPYNSCGAHAPTGFAVLQGYYGSGNYTGGQPLTLYNTTNYQLCTTTSPPAYYVFAPSSTNASACTSFGCGYSYSTKVAYSGTGYWTGSGPTASFHHFDGTYTIIAGDEWGNLVIQHFQVESSSSQSTTSSQAKTVTECMETITTTFVNVTTTQTATEEIACVASSSGLSVSGLSLCPTNCVYPAPYLTGQLNINGATPVKIDVYVNGTFDGTSVLNPTTIPPGCFLNGTQATCSTGSVVTTTLTRFAYIYKGSIPNEFIPAVVGDRYVVTFVASFADGSSALASAIVVATA